MAVSVNIWVASERCLHEAGPDGWAGMWALQGNCLKMFVLKKFKKISVNIPKKKSKKHREKVFENFQKLFSCFQDSCLEEKG